MKKFFPVLVAIILAGSAGIASAQSPNEQIGVGIIVGDQYSGVQGSYAISPAIHLGVNLAFAAVTNSTTVDGTTTSSSSTQVLFGAYGKFLFKGTKEFKPYAHGNLIYGSTSQDMGNGVSESVSGLSLWAGVGAEYFITSNFGAFAQIRILDLPLTRTDGAAKTTVIGIGQPAIGLEWFFN
jgi:hypothetical protein